MRQCFHRVHDRGTRQGHEQRHRRQRQGYRQRGLAAQEVCRHHDCRITEGPADDRVQCTERQALPRGKRAIGPHRPEHRERCHDHHHHHDSDQDRRRAQHLLVHRPHGAACRRIRVVQLESQHSRTIVTHQLREINCINRNVPNRVHCSIWRIHDQLPAVSRIRVQRGRAAWLRSGFVDIWSRLLTAKGGSTAAMAGIQHGGLQAAA